MKSKTIVFTEAYRAEFIETETKEMSEDDVLVKMVVSTISSGTEKANFIGDPNISIYEKNPVAKFPRIVGYSSAGIVEKTGANVNHVKPGDRVCMAGSTHTQYVVMHKDNVYKIEDDSIDLKEAALWYIACFSAASIRKCRLEFGESAIVMGMGVLGQIAVKLLLASGTSPVIAVDPESMKREIALKIGADYAFDPFDENFVSNVKKVTDGE